MPCARIGIPVVGSGTEIYTIEPLDFNLIDAMAMLFQGRCSAAGAECRQVPTSASPDPSHLFGVPGEFGPISLGADSLDATCGPTAPTRTTRFWFSHIRKVRRSQDSGCAT